MYELTGDLVQDIRNLARRSHALGLSAKYRMMFGKEMEDRFREDLTAQATLISTALADIANAIGGQRRTT